LYGGIPRRCSFDCGWTARAQANVPASSAATAVNTLYAETVDRPLNLGAQVKLSADRPKCDKQIT